MQLNKCFSTRTILHDIISASGKRFMSDNRQGKKKINEIFMQNITLWIEDKRLWFMQYSDNSTLII